ncbi:hypothetical protein Csa_002458 [Cucumis sativus]|nr:hypothetical protein Csa_002458 [Cucumis sativus]
MEKEKESEKSVKNWLNLRRWLENRNVRNREERDQLLPQMERLTVSGYQRPIPMGLRKRKIPNYVTTLTTSMIR